MKSYPIAGFTLGPLVQLFCDDEGYVYMKIERGFVTYHNRFNGWHSRRPVSS